MSVKKKDPIGKLRTEGKIFFKNQQMQNSTIYIFFLLAPTCNIMNTYTVELCTYWC